MAALRDGLTESVAERRQVEVRRTAYSDSNASDVKEPVVAIGVVRSYPACSTGKLS